HSRSDRNLPRNLSSAEIPGRSELFNVAQMEQLARVLAKSHQLDPGHSPDRLLARLADNRVVLTDACELLTVAVKDNLRIAPAGEWLLDNFYLIEEQISTSERHLPKGYSRELPRLLSGSSAQLPRVYDIALETISHNDGRVDPESLAGFVSAYQSVNILTLGELWAIPIMLRLALIENLRRVSARVAGDRIHRNLANLWADRMTGTVEKDPKNLILVIADMARSRPPLVSSFVAELTRRLQGQGPSLALALTWIEQQLADSSLTIEQLIREENQQQAADQVSMSNGIGSLRFLGSMDWREFVEKASVVEGTLGEDPSGIYDQMDFNTRDRYRHVVEKLSHRSPGCESSVALAAVELAREGAKAGGTDCREAHVGYYLIDQGLPRLERAVHWHASPLELLRRIGRRFPLTLYLGSILAMTALLSGALILKASSEGLGGLTLLFLGLLSVVCTSQLAIALTNWLATLAATPVSLPRMDFSKGIPSEFRTLVVVPTMLTSTANIEDLAEAMEVRFLANRDENLHFGLLTDLRDAAQQTLPEDEPLLEAASRKVRELNERYPGAPGDLFFLFHRPRLWNAREGIWMGEERKRGKLADLNALLRGKTRAGFSLIEGDPAVLREVKYVITLDTDTGLARDTARQFVGTMAHPLNRPVYDPRAGRVTAGYGILQPRVAVALSGAGRSRYARMFTSELGIDPYTRAVSDVYQDLFAEGSFIGKGIYDVDAFEQAVGGRFPDNLILSHDLLEGCHARCGLLSDVQLYEESPSRYSSDVSRRHRWIRGDWQIVRWLFPGTPGADGHLHRNPLSVLSRWKILDNLRRSLTAPALIVLFALGWMVLSPALFWTLSGLGILLIPSMTGVAHGFLRKPSEMTLAQHLGVTRSAIFRTLERDVFALASLPHEAFYSLDAIARTLWRLWFSRKRLLEWNPSTSPSAQVKGGLAGSIRLMWFAPVFAVATAVFLLLWRPESLPVAAPILTLWLASPGLAWWCSRTRHRHETGLSSSQILFLEKLSRKTWAFFETFVGPEDHWLVPDNFQETPSPVTAHRTSPTNMGLSLLANCSAFDFGYISQGNLIARTDRTLASMEAMERHRGHFYNWYDTQTLQPLPPRYISSVDSGNLAGHLLTLRQAMLSMPALPIFGERQLDGIMITWKLLLEAAGDSCQDLLAPLGLELKSMTDSRPLNLRTAHRHLGKLAAQGTRFADGLEASSATPDEPLLRWARAFSAQCDDALSELATLAPWLGDPELVQHVDERPGLVRIPTLIELAALDAGPPPLGDADPLGPEDRSAQLRELVRKAASHAAARISAMEDLAARLGAMARIEFGFLYDQSRHLLSIGYNVAEQQRDSSCYDLLASEARLASFVAIAQGQLGQETWFAMGRLLTSAGADPILLSWSGSMFEYLMPML
ncbi:cyclic beta 1-2 glucan synthetase, partial [Myxococcota bacterium]|nr:cyclic beta 1-2 glucan synthetase [Myxococcota bacterium]